MAVAYVTNFPAEQAVSGTVTAVIGIAANWAVNQASVTTTASIVIASRAGRRTARITNLGSTDVWLGSTAGLTTSNGILLRGISGGQIEIPFTGDIYAIVAVGTATIGVEEFY